jgi:hypothetical protein
LVEARAFAAQILNPPSADVVSQDAATLERFVELRGSAPERLDESAARAIVRELKKVGGNLKALRVALTGVEKGPELWAVLVALGRGEALARAERATAR